MCVVSLWLITVIHLYISVIHRGRITIINLLMSEYKPMAYYRNKPEYFSNKPKAYFCKKPTVYYRNETPVFL